MALVSGGHIMPAADLLATVAGFYNTIIAVLTTLLTILGAFTFIYLKSFSRQQAHEIVKDEVIEKLADKNFIYNQLTDNTKVSNEINQIITKVLGQSIGDVSDMGDRISRLESAVSTLSHFISDTVTPSSASGELPAASAARKKRIS